MNDTYELIISTPFIIKQTLKTDSLVHYTIIFASMETDVLRFVNPSFDTLTYSFLLFLFARLTVYLITIISDRTHIR